MSLFEKASRQRIRFESAKGLLNVEDLWDLPLTAKNNGASLDNIARDLSRKVKDTETESFVLKSKKADSTLQLSFDIVKHIIEVLLAEKDEASQAKDRKEKKDKILSILAEKKDEKLKSSSVEELEALANSL